MAQVGNTLVRNAHPEALLAVIWLLLINCCVASAQTSSKEESESYWWQAFQAADQSTAPAEDLIPYSWIKNEANENIVKPVQQSWDGTKPSRSTYHQRGEFIQKWRRDQLMQSIKQDRNTSYPVFLDDLDSVPDSPIKPGGADVAPSGNWRPIERQSFIQVAAPIIERELDPSQHTGKIKMLETAQTIQHMIDCQTKGKSAEECVKSYTLNFATSKAITEVLSIVGQHAGWRLVKDAALGEAVLTGAATVGYLAYADYVAIQNILELAEVRGAMQSDELSNIRQAENNEASDRNTWDGSLSQLRTRLDLFTQQLEASLGPAGEELFRNWGKAEQCASDLKGKRQAIVDALNLLSTPENLKDAVASACKARLGRESELQIERLQEELEGLEETWSSKIEEAEALSHSCNSEQDRDVLSDLCETLKTLENKMAALQKELEQATGSAKRELKDAAEKEKKRIIAEAARAENVEAAYKDFIKNYDICTLRALRAYSSFDDYQKSENIFKTRAESLVFFLRSRAKDVLWAEKLEQVEGALSQFESNVRNYKPKRMPFDKVEQYESELTNIIKDLRYMKGMEPKIRQQIEERLSALKNTEASCESPADLPEKGWKQEAESKRVEAVLQAIKNCASVEVPNLVGLTLGEAKRRLLKLDLKPAPEVKKEPVTSEDKSWFVTWQKPFDGTRVSKKTEVHILHWGPFDAKAKCQELASDYSAAIADKDLPKARNLLKELKRRNCPQTQGAERDLAQAEFFLSQAQKVQVPRVIGIPGTEAEKRIARAGFEVKSIPSQTTTTEESLAGTVKEQEPQGGSWHFKGKTRVVLRLWPAFDPSKLEAQANCTSPSGSTPKWNTSLKKMECICPGNTVKTTLKSSGPACVLCEQMEQYYKSARLRGNMSRAESIRNLSRHCPWAQNTANALDEESGQKIECQNKVAGSLPVLLRNGTYRCDCPAGTVMLLVSNRHRCAPCGEVLNHVNQAFTERRFADAERLIASSRHCAWHNQAAQALMQNQQNQLAWQQQQNQASCQQLHQQIQFACQNRQWMSLPALYAQAGQIPGCSVDPSLMTYCTSAQAAETAQNLANAFSRPPQQPAAMPWGGGFAPPQRPGKPPQNRPPAANTNQPGGDSFDWFISQTNYSYRNNRGQTCQVNYRAKDTAFRSRVQTDLDEACRKRCNSIQRGLQSGGSTFLGCSCQTLSGPYDRLEQVPQPGQGQHNCY